MTTQLPDGAAFFAAMRQAGAKANYGSVGAGSVAHLGMELLKAKAGIAPVHVPYSGNPAVVTAIIGEQVQMALVPPGVAMPQVHAGKLKAIGVTSGRSAARRVASSGWARKLSLAAWVRTMRSSGLVARVR